MKITIYPISKMGFDNSTNEGIIWNLTINFQLILLDLQFVIIIYFNSNFQLEMFVCVYIYIQSKKDQDQKFTGKAFMLINGEIVCVCGGGGGGSVKC